ncbi:MAG: hypothetical protein ACYSXF_05900 [Planctomycetota bacterium]|jgi:hypothetical protein
MAAAGKVALGALLYGIVIGVVFGQVYPEVAIDGALGFLFAVIGLVLSLATAAVYRRLKPSQKSDEGST